MVGFSGNGSETVGVIIRLFSVFSCSNSSLEYVTGVSLAFISLYEVMCALHCDDEGVSSAFF